MRFHIQQVSEVYVLSFVCIDTGSPRLLGLELEQLTCLRAKISSITCMNIFIYLLACTVGECSFFFTASFTLWLLILHTTIHRHAESLRDLLSKLESHDELQVQ